MADKVPKNKLVNPYRRCQLDQSRSPCAEQPLNPLAEASRPLSDAPEIFRRVFNAFRFGFRDE